MDTSLNIDKYGVEAVVYLNESNANTLYHWIFGCQQIYSWAENQWKLIDNDVSLHRGVVETPVTHGLVIRGTSWVTKEWSQEKWYSH